MESLFELFRKWVMRLFAAIILLAPVAFFVMIVAGTVSNSQPTHEEISETIALDQEQNSIQRIRNYNACADTKIRKVVTATPTLSRDSRHHAVISSKGMGHTKPLKLHEDKNRTVQTFKSALERPSAKVPDLNLKSSLARDAEPLPEGQ